MQVIKTEAAPNQFKLQEMPAGATPGITKEETEEEIKVCYQNRFTLYDEAAQASRPVMQEKTIKTDKRVPRLGVMLVGLAGNNGSTFVSGILANKMNMSWETKNGMQAANFYGSFTQSATTHVGFKFDETTGNLSDVNRPIKDLLPTVNPVDLEVSGWDISDKNLFEAAQRSCVLEPTLLEQLKPHLENIRPLKAALNPDFIAANQTDRSDNVLEGTNRELIDKLRQDIRDMKERVDKVIVLWTANTEMFLLPEINAMDDLMSRVEANAPLPASVLYCMAAIEEKCVYLNGSPQNTFHPAIVEYAK